MGLHSIIYDIAKLCIADLLHKKCQGLESGPQVTGILLGILIVGSQEVIKGSVYFEHENTFCEFPIPFFSI